MKIEPSMTGDTDDRRAQFDAKLDALFDFVPEEEEFDDDSDDLDDSDDSDEGDASDLEVLGTVAAEPGTKAHGQVRSVGTDHDGERLQKVMAKAGVGSRRTCEELIDAGKVRVNEEVAVLGRRVDPENDLITVNGAPIPTREGLVHYLLNKPRGVVTTSDDEHGRETVMGLVPETPRVFSVGRLDIETEGLLIITNDGELAFRLTHPSFGVEKEYLAKVHGYPTEHTLRRLREGIELDDGTTSPAKVSLIGPDLVEITIHEGRNRQVRRMFDAVGHPVLRLARTRIGSLADRELPPGRWRPLTNDEIHALGRTVRTTRTMRRSAERGEPVEHTTLHR